MSTANAPHHLAHWRQRCLVHLDPSARQGSSLSPTNRFLTTAIVLSVVIAILDSEPLINQRWGVWKPEAFGSIPLTMWWAFVTLTTGILASAFSDTLQRHRQEHVHEENH